MPIPNANSVDVQQIQLSLIVDYHETNLLTQLNKIYRDDLIKSADIGGKQTKGKDQLSPKPVNTTPVEKVKGDDTDYANTSNQAFEDFNELSNIGKPQMIDQQNDKAQRNRGIVQVDMKPTRLNSMSLDRFTYTLNCPTKYTDPSGHCNVVEGIAGIGIITVAEIIFSLPYIAGFVQFIETGTFTPPTSAQIELEEQVVFPLNAIGLGLIVHSQCVLLK